MDVRIDGYNANVIRCLRKATKGRRRKEREREKRERERERERKREKKERKSRKRATKYIGEVADFFSLANDSERHRKRRRNIRFMHNFPKGEKERKKKARREERKNPSSPSRKEIKATANITRFLFCNLIFFSSNIFFLQTKHFLFF